MKIFLTILLILIAFSCQAQFMDVITRYDFRLIELPEGVGVPIDFRIDEINNTISLSFTLADTSVGHVYYETPFTGTEIPFYINNSLGIWNGDTAMVSLTQQLTSGIWELCGAVVTVQGQEGWSHPKYIVVDQATGFIMILMSE